MPGLDLEEASYDKQELGGGLKDRPKFGGFVGRKRGGGDAGGRREGGGGELLDLCFGRVGGVSRG